MTCAKRLCGGFTLVELLVVMGLMGMLAAFSIGGYNAAVRGMEERGVKESVVSLIRLAEQRALIDGVPTMVILSNRRLKAAGDDQAEMSVGDAVAVRMAGRISQVDGSFVVDEFAGWENTYPQDGHDRDPEMRLYRISSQKGANLDTFSSLVPPFVTAKQMPDQYLVGAGMITNQNFRVWGFEVKDGYKNWKAGDPYGFEIGNLTLPRNYIFGTSKPTDEKGEVASVLYFAPESLSASQYKFTSFGDNVTIAAIRARAGGSQAVKIHTISANDLD